MEQAVETENYAFLKKYIDDCNMVGLAGAGLRVVDVCAQDQHRPAVSAWCDKYAAALWADGYDWRHELQPF